MSAKEGKDTMKNHPIVVGIMPKQDEIVPVTACAMATDLGCRAIFVYADPSKISVDGEQGHATSIDPDIVDDVDEQDRITAQMKERLQSVTSGREAEWEFRYVAGAPAAALANIALEEDAAFIMIGSREPGLGARMKEFVSGPVADALMHSQPRPVVVIPQKHSTMANASPWV